MSLNIKQLRHLVVRPVLQAMAERTAQASWYSEAAEELVMATAYAESNFEAIRQYARRDGRRGPARGMWQVEHPTTHRALWRWLDRRGFTEHVTDLLGVQGMDEDRLTSDLRYGALMCRVFYRRKPSALPTTYRGMGEYWKKHYNTYAGAGTVGGFMGKHRKMRTLEKKQLL